MHAKNGIFRTEFLNPIVWEKILQKAIKEISRENPHDEAFFEASASSVISITKKKNVDTNRHTYIRACIRFPAVFSCLNKNCHWYTDVRKLIRKRGWG